MQRREPHLFRQHPRLAEHVPWMLLGGRRTPIEPLAALGREAGGLRLYVKRDDSFARDTDAPAGPGGARAEVAGAKLRKLEFVLADAVRRHSDVLVTIGAFGSNHLYATAACGRELGMRTIGVTMPQPSQPHARRNLRASLAVGTELSIARGAPGVMARTAWTLGRTVATPGVHPYFGPPGGSSPLGVLGAVEAALEIAAQVRAGEAPAPDYVFVPAGSCGLLAGLALGLELAGLGALAVGVRVFSRSGCNEWTTRRLAGAARALLERADPGVATALAGRSVRFRMLHDFFGTGYGRATEAGRRAIETVSRLEGLALEPTYGAKALAGMLAFMRAPGRSRETALFVHTCRVAPSERVPDAPALGGVPRRVRAFLESEEA
ncbi:MAG: pyridoxal-phosphate dependent enzyme [Polyangiaceae bacterium]|nr:pyridoxal-phosphate dependent enzyme [Polyangiaceae bacterium]